MFCRNCGKDLVGTPEICANCGSHPVNATAFCRFCGSATNAREVMCPKCGAAIGTFAKSGKATKEVRGWSTKTKKKLIILAAVIVSVYAVLALPSRTVLKPLQSALSDFVVSTVGYTTLPLSAISSAPSMIPVPIVTEFGNVAVFTVNEAQQLTISAIYRNTTTSNAKGTGRSEDVTANSTFQSSDDNIATVTSGGLVRGVASGTADITVSYTAAPGSANIFSAAKGKVPITVTVTVPVTVR